MISWAENDITEPPLQKQVSSDSLKEFIRKTSETEPNRNVDPVILSRASSGKSCETGDRIASKSLWFNR